ncbi:RagB/SusD family nutrient uptake outer membrane protein [Mucilaginibacter sp. Bleaf8]|uniref:RagB/SusD family nutrient uptake outer membrane protein n=1 Tax=Mucilaginibacter sp. Bleaf8 TaxID=2834430 RepID=UPI001BCAEF7B|nr:RagB/SusD family nutrient uptake outer membrane protein [Mucilaginibacter sp. Bleaf8]MBS7564896.1 RagB/SusD family nutrient uptake outer membrane protein [Mucilaginibacter sp. Bleaf8]
MKNIYISLLFVLFGTIILSSCKKVLDKQDLNKASPELVFSDSILVKQQLDYIYNQNLPTWFGNTGGSLGSTNGLADDGYSDNKYVQGSLTINDVVDIGSTNTSGNYNKLRIINTFIDGLKTSPLPNDQKKRFAAQAIFFRAFRYFDLVRLYGGVPLILTPLEGVGPDAKDAAKLPRNSTSECIKQIVADLDTAIKYLPKKWLTADYGRITAGGAMAFKGRVLLTYASPQFLSGDNTATDQSRWQTAYEANTLAYNYLISAGYGLNSSYDGLWFTEGYANPEAVMITGFNTSQGQQTSNNNGYESSTRPAYLSSGNSSSSNQPTWDLVQSYPMKDGKAPGSPSSKYTYSVQNFYKNRDPRFDKTIAYNGSTWSINNNPNYRLWTYIIGTKSVEPVGATTTGFYLRKAIDPTLALNNVPYAGADWIEIRFAEVVLNLAECAAETGRMDEAFEKLKTIRQRAGIEPGDGNYGLDEVIKGDRLQMINAIMLERQIEFAFEGKRFWDLRRRRLLTALNGKQRSGIKISATADAPTNLTASGFPGRDALSADAAYTYFTITVVPLDTKYKIGYQPGIYFFGIPTATINSDPAIVQTNTWGGTFDPFK